MDDADHVQVGHNDYVGGGGDDHVDVGDKTTEEGDDTTGVRTMERENGEEDKVVYEGAEDCVVSVECKYYKVTVHKVQK